MKQKTDNTLVDLKHQIRFSINSEEKKTFISNNRTGILKSTNDGREGEYSSTEFGSVEEINDCLSINNTKRSIKVDNNFNSQFTASRILRENQDILNTLENLNLYKWTLSSKVTSIQRYILKKSDKFKKNIFNHFNLSINFKLSENIPAIEIGVGVSDNLRINRDALKSRLKDIIENNRNFKNIEFKKKLPIILDAGDGGILFHEIIGHSLEADYIAQKISPFTINDIGKQIFPKNLTISTSDKNDKFFSLNSDDEGNELIDKDLISNGILNKILTDNYHNKLLNIQASGSARTENFTQLCQPRMHSIYIKPGKFNPKEMIASVKYGIFVKEFGEGKVFFSNKTFSLIIKESYLIENGIITAPLGTIVLKGNISEVLNSIKMIGNDFRYDRGVSYCSKNGQTLNVRVGQPTIKIENVLVSRPKK